MRLYYLLSLVILLIPLRVSAGLPAIPATPVGIDDIVQIPGGGYTGTVNYDYQRPAANGGGTGRVKLPTSIPSDAVEKSARAFGRGGLWGLGMLALGWLWDELIGWWYKSTTGHQYFIHYVDSPLSGNTRDLACGAYLSSLGGTNSFITTSTNHPYYICNVQKLTSSGSLNWHTTAYIYEKSTTTKTEPGKDDLQDLHDTFTKDEKIQSFMIPGTTTPNPDIFPTVDLNSDPAIVQARNDVAAGKIPSAPYDDYYDELSRLNQELGSSAGNPATSSPGIGSETGRNPETLPEETATIDTPVTGSISIPGLPKLPYAPSFTESGQRLWTSFTDSNSLQGRLRAVAFPSGGSCPDSTINVLGTSFDLMTLPCQMYNSISPAISAVMLPIFGFLAFRIAASA